MNLWSRLRSLFTRTRRNRELEEELRHHTGLAEDRRRDTGLPPADAHSAALRELGNVTLALEDSRSVWSFGWLESLCPHT